MHLEKKIADKQTAEQKSRTFQYNCSAVLLFSKKETKAKTLKVRH